MSKFCLKRNALIIFFIISLTLLNLCFSSVNTANAMPYYDLRAQNLVLRASFCTDFSSSTEQRKNNIKVASKYLDNTFIDVGAEFSFNNTVGERTPQRGFMSAKIIVDGEFVDGIGGGVCQVSTTLYNAVILSGLMVTEFHPHSLAVSYVEPSFDAMVNSGWADLKFVNNTHNPILIKAMVDNSKICISIYGEKMTAKYYRQSIVTQTIPAPDYKIVYDDKGEFPELYQGQSVVLRNGKNGLKSQGYLICYDGKKEIRQKLRNDKYNAIRGVVLYGTAIEQPKEEQNAQQNQE